MLECQGLVQRRWAAAWEGLGSRLQGATFEDLEAMLGVRVSSSAGGRNLEPSHQGPQL